MRRIVLLNLSIVTLVLISNANVNGEVVDREMITLLKAFEKMSKMADKVAQDVIEMEEEMEEEAMEDVEKRDIDSTLSV